MIKIELIRFEAQDVITASNDKPTSVPSTTVQYYCSFCHKYVDRGSDCKSNKNPFGKHF